MTAKPEVLQLSNRSQWRSWLEQNHATTPAIVLVIHKVTYRACGLGLEEAVEEALCFGWIDSTLHSLDDKRYLLKFTPRRRESVWSIRNIRRVERLTHEGLMTPAGRRKIEEAKLSGAWEEAARREETDRIPEELERVLRRKKGAIAGYRALSETRKKQLLHWLFTAKRDETRASRMNAIVSEALGDESQQAHQAVIGSE
ncbi:YdeI family protein [Candidatus Zixiibacteriota bacterium]